MFIREWCESKGLIQARVVDHIDVEKSLVSRWWHKKTRPDPRHVLAIADMLGIDPRWLNYHPKEVGPKDVELMELWWSLDPSQQRKAKTVLAAYFSEDSEQNPADQPAEALPNDVAHLAKMKVALDEQSKAVAEIIISRLAGNPDPKATLDAKILSAARSSTEGTMVKRSKPRNSQHGKRRDRH